MDLYSRKALAYRVSLKHSSQLASGAFKLAYADRKPTEGLIFHSDRVPQYTAHSFQKLMKSCKVIQSFSPSGSPHHNAVMEAFFSSMKQEELYRVDYRSAQELKERIVRYIDFYNTNRPHSTLNFKTPNAHELLFYERESGYKELDNPVHILEF
jgi:transposase InsO family protein